MTIRTVRDLITALEQFPDYYPLQVEVTVGGDLVHDTVALDEVRAEGLTDPYVCLVPAPDEYDTRGLIDEGLAVRADREAPRA